MHRLDWAYEQSASPSPWAIMLESFGGDSITGMSCDVTIYHETLKDGVETIYNLRCNDSRFLAAYIEHVLRKHGLSFSQADYHSLYMTIKQSMHRQGVIDND